VLLFNADPKIELAMSGGDKNALITSLSKIKTYFIISGVLILLMIIIFLISLLITGSAFFSALNSF